MENSGSNYNNIKEFSVYLNGRPSSRNASTQSEFTKFLREPLLTRFERGLSYHLSKLYSNQNQIKNKSTIRTTSIDYKASMIGLLRY